MRIIAHLDMDAFFASVEEADNPHFKGLPIVVGAEPGEGYSRGVVSTANYAARAYGIKSALPVSKAWQLSQKAVAEGKPEAIFLPVNFERYRQVSAQVFEIIKKYSRIVEPVSIDEFYFDLSFCKNFIEAEKKCEKIKKEIKEKLKITCSVGIGTNKLISKIAAGVKKPDGLYAVKPNDVESFLESLPARELPGVGPKTDLILKSQNVKTIKDLKKFEEKELESLFGKLGRDLYNKSRGIDDSPVTEEYEAKSIGEQETFPHDTLDAGYIGQAFENMCKNVFKRFEESGFETFKTVTVVARFSDFKTFTSSKTLPKPSGLEKEFKIQALGLLLPYLDRRKNPGRKAIRLVGVKLGKFNSPEKSKKRKKFKI